MKREQLRLLMVLSAAHGEEVKHMLHALRHARKHVREYTVYAEFFDPQSESHLRYQHFPERLEKMRRGHFDAVLIMGSASSDHIIDLLEAIPEEGVDVGNFATPGRDLDQIVQKVLGAPNRMMRMLEAQDSS